MQCGFPSYADNNVQCYDEAIEDLDIEISDGSKIVIHTCDYHSSTWEIVLGHKGLAKLIGSGKIKYESK